MQTTRPLLPNSFSATSQTTTDCPGSDVLRPLSHEAIDSAASYLEPRSLCRLSNTCKRMQWVCEDRIKMHGHFMSPEFQKEGHTAFGLTIIYDKNNRKPTLLKIQEIYGRRFCLEAYLMNSRKSLGSVDFRWARPGGYGEYYGYNDGTLFQNPYEFDRDKDTRGELYIRDLGVVSGYSGAGTALMHSSAELASIHGIECDLRIWADASWKSLPFYWHLGLRCHCEMDNSHLAKTLTKLWRQGETRLKSDGSAIMLLPEAAKDSWRRTMRQNPILMMTRFITIAKQELLPYISQTTTLVLEYLQLK